ncbi:MULTISPECIES: hypothetical protein [Caballeronia]|uniref:Uncharacterized protein n=1 Tax=Caballeronia zhejiangensis TaxID=871203 RepID=A0A656QL30_9BURK|nr:MULTISPECIES: hypothetical protein [Caballeronia]EKS67896.1 hypothetical protein BURK_022730 [Burkholderia sp. SJ98]KDR31551.1 hypothetical protein BG60_29115 [Caballeronia zhejiangensis]
MSALPKLAERDRINCERGARICAVNNYSDYRTFENERDACIAPFLFTYAILADLDEWGYGDRWCYHTYADARRALDAWDGEYEPAGWLRHPASGRRGKKDSNDFEEIRL